MCRVKANPKNAINEHMLANFLDFVIWGHEHECLVDPQVLHIAVSLVTPFLEMNESGLVLISVANTLQCSLFLLPLALVALS